MRRTNGTGTIHDGYVRHNINGELVRMHTLIAEKAIGKKLPPGAHVHHVDGNGLNNSPSNLVICPDDAYHKLLHLRTRMLEECGDANKRKCQFCHQYDYPENMRLNSRMYHHAECRKKDNAIRWAKRKEKKNVI